MIKKEDGVITIWLSAMLLIMLVFIGTVIECVRINIAKSYSNMSLRLATESVLADYDPNLYKHYHIFCVNTEAVDINSRLDKYAKASFDKDGLIGMKVNNIYASNCSYVSSNISGYIKEQISNYINKKKGIALSKDKLVDYVMKNFSSYADIVPNSNMKKKKIYEVEYIIAGKGEDNDNVEAITSTISGFDAIKYPMSSYKSVLRGKLSSMSEGAIISRMCSLIEDNLYNTYGKSINFSKCVTSMKVSGSYGVNGKFAIKNIGQYTINNSMNLGY